MGHTKNKSREGIQLNARSHMQIRYWILVGLVGLNTSCNFPGERGAKMMKNFTPIKISEHNLKFGQPIQRWDEALPLGNGLMGVLVWGDGHPLRLSLDRADLWDLRPVKEWESPDYNYETMHEWVRDGRIEDLRRLYEHPYRDNPGPTKIPAGRIEISFESNNPVRASELALETAIARVTLQNGAQVEIFQHATEPVGMLKISGNPDSIQFQLVAPAFGVKVVPGQNINELNAGDLARLGYAPPKTYRRETGHDFEQSGWGDFKFAISLNWHVVAKDEIVAAWSISSSFENASPLEVARERVQTALKIGFASMQKSHSEWWQNYWNQCRVAVPNAIVERQWYLDTYKFGATARKGAPPISLQAIWTADEGQIPPWKGDYHHDLNTQLSYWPCYSGNHLSEGLSFLDWLWQVRPAARDYTQKFFHKPGLCVPMTSDLNGRQMGGWHQYTHSPTVAAWLAQHFYLHWKYSQDREFLESRAFPYLSEVAEFLAAVTEKDANGQRYLPLSSSPEMFDNRLEAWLPPTSNYDLALLRWLFAATVELARELNREKDAEQWQIVLDELPPFSFSPEDHRLLIAPGVPLDRSHRHHSHLLAIHPLGLFQWERGEADREVIRAALAELERLGTDYWTGYSFSWLASLAARGKDGARAEQALQIFAEAFCSPNSFHLNGDQTKSGFSKFNYRPFTLEGNMAAAAGLQEMLLQSNDGVVRIFPAIPRSWETVGFYQLRAAGAFLVSARKTAGEFERVTIFAEKGGTLVLENPFGAQPVALKVHGANQISDEKYLKFSCEPGAEIEISR
jgi:hypothetical protein